jgi:hypothetical protein
MSSLFHPFKLVCVCCKKEDAIISHKPVVVFSHQNFVTTLECESQDCINTIRLENASLNEVFEYGKEIFG